jgi:hypothetical protein
MQTLEDFGKQLCGTENKKHGERQSGSVPGNCFDKHRLSM